MNERAAEEFVDTTPGEIPVRGFLHRAVTPSGDGLVLTHGASGNCNALLLVALAEAFAATGVNVLRFDLPFRQSRPHGPPSPRDSVRDQEGIRRALALARSHITGRLFVGGQSYGGRQASMLAAQDPTVADALLLLSYPLHPPGRPAQLRTAHFPELEVPTLFVHGTTDPFASSEELETAVRLIPARTKVIEIAGAGHSLLTKRNRDEVVKTVVESFRELLQ